MGTAGHSARLVLGVVVSVQNDAAVSVRSASTRYRYEDLRTGEVALRCYLLVILIALGAAPLGTGSRPESTERPHSHRHGDDAVAQVAATPYSETQRMELRALILLASEIVAYYWPMRTFVHHNPLHGLEDLPFDEAVRRGSAIARRQGICPVRFFATIFAPGRILPRHLDAALKPRRRTGRSSWAAREITHLDVLRACCLRTSRPRR